VKPLVLPPNQFPRFYRGGPRIAAFRGIPPAGDRTPEDWIGSTTRAWGEGNGPSRLADGSELAAVLGADPESFFGPSHLARHGAEPGVLVKLLDAGERLPVHYHPDRAFAERHLGIPHGKTEAWIILEAERDAAVWLGFERDFDPVWVETQDVVSMLSAMQHEPVAAGDVLYVPAGVPHAIGEGILLLELQEPSDLSLLLEWRGIVEQEDAFLGLDAAQALEALRAARRIGLASPAGSCRRLPMRSSAQTRAPSSMPASRSPSCAQERERSNAATARCPYVAARRCSFRLQPARGGSPATRARTGAVRRGKRLLLRLHGQRPDPLVHVTVRILNREQDRIGARRER
jgi:mannose-6-phosphate isomerase